MDSISTTRATIIISEDKIISLFQAQSIKTNLLLGRWTGQNIGMDKNSTIWHKNKRVRNKERMMLHPK